MSKVIWLDNVSIFSLLKVVFLKRHYRISEVRFFTASCFIFPLIDKMERFLNCPFRVFSCGSYAERNVGNISLFEDLQIKLTELLDGWARTPSYLNELKKAQAVFNPNQEKLSRYIKDRAYLHLHRFVEMAALVCQETNPDDHIILIRKTPLYQPLKNFFPTLSFETYFQLIRIRALTTRREGYTVDYNKAFTHHYTRAHYIAHILYFWVTSLICSFISFFSYRSNEKSDQNNPVIACELLQPRIRDHDINDMYWLKHSGIDPNRVITFEFLNYDRKSNRLLNAMKVRRARIIRNWLVSLKSLFKPGISQPISPRFTYYKNTFPFILRAFKCCFSWKESTWLSFQVICFLCLSRYWKDIYEQKNIKLVWSMQDNEPEKYPKSQAIEEVGGLLLGSHWSNYPIPRTILQKGCDVIFTWGPHFVKYMFDSKYYLRTFIVGYPSDHYFAHRTRKAENLRSRWPDKFILSYHDNVMSYDGLYSFNAQISIHQMMMDLMDRYPNLICVLKPKRRAIFEEIVNRLPLLQDYMNDHRLLVYLGDSARTKAVPAEIGMASDLAIGLGVSTPAAECYFAGTMAYHADFTGFWNNVFVNKGSGKIVFHSIRELDEAVKQYIETFVENKSRAYQELYKELDPFQDGLAYKRTGYIIKEMLKGFDQQLNRHEILEVTNKSYEDLMYASRSMLSLKS